LTFLYTEAETGTAFAAYLILERPYARFPDGYSNLKPSPLILLPPQ
jgi:hypothetical protein